MFLQYVFYFRDFIDMIKNKQIVMIVTGLFLKSVDQICFIKK